MCSAHRSVRLEDSLEGQLQCSLYHAVAYTRNLERTEFAVPLRYVNPPVWHGFIPVCFQVFPYCREKASPPSDPELEAEADARRDRLIRIFSALRHRFHETMSLKGQATQHPISIAVVGAGSLFALAEGARLAISHLSHKQEEPTLSERLTAVRNVWREPQRLARPRRFQLVKGVALGVVIFISPVLATRLATKAAVPTATLKLAALRPPF